MPLGRRPWQEELAIIDHTMKAISDVTDPETLVNIYYDNIGGLIPANDYVSISRRNVAAPFYLITRSSRFKQHFNPWTQRDLLPRLSGGLLGEIAYANAPVIIDDVPARLKAEDPAHFYLEGFQSLVALPHYEANQGINVTIMLMPAGREMDKAMIPMLHWQSGLFGRGTTNLVLRNQLSDALKALDRELQVVGEIQRSLLPPQLPKIPGFEIAAHYHTSARAGGDYYDFFPLDDGACGLFIADVSGHGTPAAVFMAITHAIAHTEPNTHTPPAKLLEYLNHHLARTYTRDGSFVTAFYAVLDPLTRTLTYARAGHNPPRLIRGERIISLDATGALPLGILYEQLYEQSTIQLEKGDLLLLYTDGITEATAPLKGAKTHQFFGTSRLDQILRDCKSAPAQECITKIRSALSAFTENAPPTDDQTLLALRCL
ncbi:MAG TPA: PP2C family protein-serine/threonine phosphatase [Tepidisphaeraceae bacterium]|jgi:sigma-B regulation protein RsbU (phosphoserine phosphatase)|nr:PP2C family protein-serine/threonine phosphatase [Tepidisphaeraceae bacterium]